MQNKNHRGKAGLNKWIAVDLDGTLAWYDQNHDINIIGDPIEETLFRVKQWVAEGIEVRIFTARAAVEDMVQPVKDWLSKHDLPDLTVTNLRDNQLIQMWDDRCIQVETNTGEILTPQEYINLNVHGWIGCELDGTLATTTDDPHVIGEPVMKMMARVQQWHMAGIDIRLFTNRACDPAQIDNISQWLSQHGLEGMKITHEKDFRMVQFWDHRAIHVVSNTGQVAAPLNTLELPAD
jgi:hypothetical protein